LINERLKYYQVLGIQPTDNVDAIKKAYRKMAFRFHPDKNSSEDAHNRFIKITEAYEILTGQRKITDPKAKQKTPEENFAEKVTMAKDRFHRQQEEELRKDALYYRIITSGWKWAWFKRVAYYCMFISICLSIDYFANGNTETLTPPKESFAYWTKVISAKREKFNVTDHEYWNKDYYGQIRGNRSLLFNDLKSISVILNPPDMSMNKHADKMKNFQDFDSFELYTVVSFGSMYGVFPLVHVFLFVPMALVVYKRPTLRFSIWRLVSIYFLFPLAIFITFSNDRIFHLLGLM